MTYPKAATAVDDALRQGCTRCKESETKKHKK